MSEGNSAERDTVKEQVRAERQAQGLPPTVQDSEALRRIAAIIAAAEAKDARK